MDKLLFLLEISCLKCQIEDLFAGAITYAGDSFNKLCPSSTINTRFVCGMWSKM